MNQELDDRSGTFENQGDDYLGQATLIYSHYPWEFAWGARGISDGFNPLLGYIPRQNIFGPNFDIRYFEKTDQTWYKELSGGYEFDYYWDQSGSVSIHDHALYGWLLLPSDIGFRSALSHEYPAPYQNYRALAGFNLFASDFWKSVSLNWAGGRFEDVDYNELMLAKPFKPWNRLPIRFESFLRFEEQPDGSHDILGLTRAQLYVRLRKHGLE